MKIKAGVSATLIANVIFAISQWVIIASLNYTGRTDVVGQYAFAIALAGLFLTVGQLGLRPYLLSSVIKKQEIQHVFHVRIITSVIAFLLLGIFSYYFLSPSYFVLIITLGMVKVVENLSDICHGYYQKSFHIYQIVVARIFRAITSPILFVILFFYSESIILASVGLLVSLLLTFYFFDRKALQQQEIQITSVISIQQFKNIAVKSFPMGIATVFVILVVNIPLFILKKDASDNTIGMYASVFYFVTAGSLVLQSAMQVISPILTKNIQDKSLSVVKSLIFKSFIMAAMFGVFGIALASLFGDFILTLLYGSAFKEMGGLLVIAALINSALAFQSVSGVALTSFGSFKYQMYCMIFAIPVCYFSSTFLVSLIGINGALYSGAFTSFIIAGLFLVKLLKKLNEIEKN